MSHDHLTQALTRLWLLLKARQIEHVLVGGLAVLQYVDGRNTEDIDLILAASALSQLPEIDIQDQNNNFAYGRFEGLEIDLLLTDNPVFAAVQQHHTTERDFLGQRIPCATVEGLILLKLYALPSLYRAGNFARVGLYENDIATLYQAYRPPLEPLIHELAPHLSSNDMNELRAIIADITRRVQRFDGTP